MSYRVLDEVHRYAKSHRRPSSQGRGDWHQNPPMFATYELEGHGLWLTGCGSLPPTITIAINMDNT